MSVAQEFKDFILRGKVVDLAVGVAVGGAFTKVIDALVKEVVMPVVGLLTSGADFSDLKLVLKHADKLAGVPEVAIHYGAFFNAVTTFLIVGLVVFSFIKLLNRLNLQIKQEESSKSEILLGEIRDLMIKAAKN
ncbi:MAG: large conductance mechanosensitive channel protein MscL [Pseudomonadota bacterium]